jgi:hypothetical protein
MAGLKAVTPDWLSQRGGEVKEGADGRSWLVYLGKEPQYYLLAVPAEGKYSCRVSQTVNGKRLDGPVTYHAIHQALAGGLEQLRQKLGW